MSDPIVPGTILTGAGGNEYIIGEQIGLFPDTETPCDAVEFGAVASMLDGRCRCTVCARCGHHTGNSHQGHYWKWCKALGAMADRHHFCCPDPAYGCELRQPPGVTP